MFKFWTLRFQLPFGGLRDNVRCSSWAHCKARSGLPSVHWTFFARCYGWGATSEYRRFRSNGGRLIQNFT